MQPTQPGLWVKPDGRHVWLCNCTGPCKGQWNELESQRQFTRHAPHRLTPAQFLQQQAQPGTSARAPAAAARGSTEPHQGHVQPQRAAPMAAPPVRSVSVVMTLCCAHIWPQVAQGSRAAPAQEIRRVAAAEPPRGPSPASRIQSPMQVNQPPAPIEDPLANIKALLALHADEQPGGGAEQAPQLQLEGDLDNDAIPPPDPEFGYTEDVSIPVQARRQEVCEALEYIRVIRGATLDNTGLDPEMAERLRRPSHTPPTVNTLERAGLRMFLARGNGSEGNYHDHRAAIIELHEEDKDIPTYEQIKCRIAQLTGIGSVRTDMCVQSCVAFTGPFVALDACPMCKEPRFDTLGLAANKRILRRTFETFPVGPQIQAMYLSPEGARLMCHHAVRTRAPRDTLAREPASMTDIDNVYCGEDYLREVTNNNIKDNDTVLMISLDGAQLYANKSSDCWFFIWVLFDLPPGKHIAMSPWFH